MLTSGTSSSLGLNSFHSRPHKNYTACHLPTRRGPLLSKLYNVVIKYYQIKRFLEKGMKCIVTLDFYIHFLHIHSAEKQICSGYEVKLSICSAHLKVSQNHALILNQKCAEESGKKSLFLCYAPIITIIKLAIVTRWAFDFVRPVRVYVCSKKKKKKSILKLQGAG